MAEVASSEIRKGFWVNHSHGNVLGATITVDQNASNIVIALVAIIVSLAAGSAWNILLFITHRIRATDSPKDGLFRQQQALYRTLSAPGAIATDSIKLLGAWYKRTSHAALRCLVPAAVGVCLAIAIIIAGVFSSYIVSNTDLEVLVAASNCRIHNLTAFLSNGAAFNELITTVASAGDSNTQQCYAPGPVPSQCNYYVQPRIQSTPSFVDCPFGNLCTNSTQGVSSAMILDTGYMDSNDVFGINASPANRVQLRRKVTCAPLNVEDHISVLANVVLPTSARPSERQSLAGEQYWTLNYGPILDLETQKPNLPNNGTTYHSTFVSNVTSTYTTAYVTRPSSPEVLAPYIAIWMPPSELQQDDADVTLMLFYTNSVFSQEPINDPVYSAHEQRIFSAFGTLYGADYPAGVMGCTEQFTFCFTSANNTRECTPPMGSTYSSFKNLLPEGINDYQLATMQLLAEATVFAGLYTPLSKDPPFLNITSHDNSFFVIDVPQDQWTIDLVKMEGLVIAYQQVFVTMQASGYSVTDNTVFKTALTPGEKALCRNQKVVKAGGVANISVFGLAFTLVVAGILFLIDFIFLRVSVTRDPVKSRLSPGVVSWMEDGIFQLHSAAYERFTLPWENKDKEIPITQRGVLLSTLGVHNSKTSAANPTISTLKLPTSTQAQLTSTTASSKDVVHPAGAAKAGASTNLPHASATQNMTPKSPPPDLQQIQFSTIPGSPTHADLQHFQSSDAPASPTLPLDAAAGKAP